MLPSQTPTDEVFLALPFPLRQPGRIMRLRPLDVLNDGHGVFGRGCHGYQSCIQQPLTDAVFFNLGSISVLAARSTPCISREIDDGFSTMAFCLGGGHHRYRSADCSLMIGPGDLFLNPRDGGEMRANYLSGFFCQISHQCLQRCLVVIGGADLDLDVSRAWFISPDLDPRSAPLMGALTVFFAFVDRLLVEHADLPSILGLDDQLYRLLAFQLIQAHSLVGFSDHCNSPTLSVSRSSFDELIDYIRANAHLSLTLTDLEERSHYSARHLQKVFRERLSCTPMQFVRRQRLGLAMQKLEEAPSGATVTAIARELGYRHLSNFTTDFQQHFGINPSVVLRQHPAGGGGLSLVCSDGVGVTGRHQSVVRNRG